MGSPLYLSEYYLTRLNVDDLGSEVGTVDRSELTQELQFGFEVSSHNESSLRKRLTLSVALREVDDDGEVGGYLIDCDILGEFNLAPDLPEEQVPAVVLFNGIGLLYDTLRGIVGNLTGSFPGGRLIMPVINPPDVVELVHRSMAEEDDDDGDGGKS